MRIISANLNGIRAAGRKGFFDWMLDQDADFVCVQETKAQMAVLTDDFYRPQPYFHAFADAEKKGYSGVGIYAKHKPKQIIDRLDYPLADSEGRYIQFDYDRFSVVSLYLPSGSSKEERQQCKFAFMDFYESILQQQIDSGRQFIICGDWNIVHTEKDIKNFKSNQKSSGCLPEERAWMDKLFVQTGWLDAFREVNQERDQYTWWSNRGRAWENNVGWRIDYQVATPGFKGLVKDAEIYKAQRFSDHAPLIIDYDFIIK